jgi:hypothetical protein
MREVLEMPILIRFVLTNIAAGAAFGWIIAALFVWNDVLGFGALLAAGPDHYLIAAVAAMQIGAMFGISYLATALMLMSQDR